MACWAVLFRQTNAVWVCFIIGVGASTAPGTQVVACMQSDCASTGVGRGKTSTQDDDNKLLWRDKICLACT